MKFILIIWFYSWGIYSTVGVPTNVGEFQSSANCIKAGQIFVQAAGEDKFHYVCVEK